jgi:hypothetical protein
VSLSGPFLFDPRAFWGDENVKMMNGEQVAAYLRLLSHQWEEGTVPAEPRKLAVIVNDGARAHTPDQFVREVWPALNGCFEQDTNDGERLVNPRLASERESWLKKKRTTRKLARLAGIASGKSRRRKAKPSNVRSTDVERTLNENEREANGKRTISSSSSLSSSCSEEEQEARVRAGESREHSDESASALWDRFRDAYPPEAIPNETAAERAFFDLYRHGELPPGDQLLSALAAWKRCKKWQDGFIPHADKYLRDGYALKPPAAPKASPSKYPILPTVAEVQARFEAEHGSGGES